MKLNVAVIGGAGFIGNRVTKGLALRGVQVISADTVSAKNGEDKIISLRLDVMNQDSVEEILLNYDINVVVHLVGLPAVADCEREPNLSFSLNSRSTQNVIEAMRRTNARRIVFASSAAVYGYARSAPVDENDSVQPDSIYGFHKLVSEELIKSYSRQYKLEHIILRLFNVYGNSGSGKDLLSILGRSIRDGKPVIISGPRKHRDFVHVDDVVTGIIKSCETPSVNTTLNIGTGVSMSFHDIASIMRSIRPRMELTEKTTEDDGTGLTANIGRAREMLGFSPTDPHGGIRNYLEGFN